MHPEFPNCRTAVLCALASLAIGACSGDKPASAAAAPPAPEVTVVTLTQQPVTLERELPGRVNPFVVAEVRPQVTGIVRSRVFTEGGMVKAGQPLYELDDATYRADLASAKANLARAETTLDSARLTERRTSALMAVDAVSKQDQENAVAALRQSEADVAATRAAVERSATVLAYAHITSPITGRIGKSSVTQGALVTANQADALATVQQLDPVYVDVTQSSAELLRLRREIASGKASQASIPVSIVLEDGTRYSHGGKLAFTDVTVDPATGSYLLRIVAPNPQGILLPGMYVRAIIANAVRQDAVLAPQRGISRDPKGNPVAMVLGPDGKVQARMVKVSQTVGDQWLVDEGLAPGDRLIVEGLQKIRPGMPAKATEPAKSPETTPPAAGAAAPKR